MKLFKTILLLLAIIISANSSLADSNISSIDSSYVINNSNAWNGLRLDIEKRAKKIQNIIIVKQEKLEKKWNEIKKLREEKESGSKVIELEVEFQKESSELQDFVQSEKKKMDIVFLKAKTIIQNKIKEIVVKIAQKKNLDAVLNISEQSVNSPVIYMADSLSITNEVLTNLNKEIPRITLDFEGK